MKRFAILLGGVSIAGLALAPLAAAQPAPVAEGPYTFVWPDGGTSAVTVAYDCGPDCYTMGDYSKRDVFRFDGATWATGSGLTTVDGRIYVKNGKTATLV